MKRIVWLLPLFGLLAACARTPASPAEEGGAALPTGTPRAEEVCVKPDDASGVTLSLFKYAAHGTFLAKPGWTIAFRSSTIPGMIQFPRAVDRGSVTIKVEPSYWKLEPTNNAAVDSQFTFRLLPDGKLTTEEAKPGWLVLTVLKAADKQGQPLVVKPWSLRIFAYDQQTANDHPYLKECHNSLAVKVDGP